MAPSCSHLVFALLLLMTSPVSGDGDNLDPRTLTDRYENSADDESAIAWAELEDLNYTTPGYDDGQLSGFLKMKDNFIDTLQSDMLDPSKYDPSCIYLRYSI